MVLQFYLLSKITTFSIQMQVSYSKGFVKTGFLFDFLVERILSFESQLSAVVVCYMILFKSVFLHFINFCSNVSSLQFAFLML